MNDDKREILLRKTLKYPLVWLRYVLPIASVLVVDLVADERIIALEY